VDRRPAQPVDFDLPTLIARQRDLDVLTAARALEMKPFLISAADFPKDDAGHQPRIVRRFVDIHGQEMRPRE